MSGVAEMNTKQLPYICQQCGKQFARLRWLQHEKDTNHRTVPNPSFTEDSDHDKGTDENLCT